MGNPAEKPMTVEDFLEWCLTQDQKWEFVGGRPVLKDVIDPARMMTGASRRHDGAVTNIIAALRTRLRGKPCRPTTDDVAVPTLGGQQVRRPDVTIDCGETLDDAMEAEKPVAVFEVLSKSTRQTDLIRKANEYQGVDTLQHVIFVEPHVAAVTGFSRHEDGDWHPIELDGLDAEIDLFAVGIRLPMAEVYEDIPLDSEAS